MQIIIPMSGIGKRFQREGYTLPKPLIDVDGKPIIGHVINMFPGENDFIFICNKDHLNEESYKMREKLLEFCPTGKILSIDPHDKGPVHAVMQAKKHIDLDSPVIVNYCDFSCYWDWNKFKTYLLATSCDGAIPCYKGFHPHSLGNTNYAYLKEKDSIVYDIQEKEPFTENKMDEYASSGTYYFKSGTLMFESFNYQIENNLSINDEFYVSLAYKYMFENNMYVSTFELEHFMQWGTPNDLEEYQRWNMIFESLSAIKDKNNKNFGLNIIPMAGEGKRYLDEGYDVPKPLIDVSGKPMIIQALDDLPNAERNFLVIREDFDQSIEIKNKILSYSNKIEFICDHDPRGQALSTQCAIKTIRKNYPDNQHPITVGACDNGAIYDFEDLNKIINHEDCDIVVWAISPDANMLLKPHMYSWVNQENGVISQILVKNPPLNMEKSSVVMGTFTFKNIDILDDVIIDLLNHKDKINNEYYLDSAINYAIQKGLKCKIFIPKFYIGWGTPNELRTFEYWQSCFHKWPYHPYSLENDSKVNKSVIYAKK